jgi:transposase
MVGKILTETQRSRLILQHKSERDRRISDRIKAVLLYDDKWSYTAIADVLFLSIEGVRVQVKDYQKNEKLKPQNHGSKSDLSPQQIEKLLIHLDEKLYDKVKDICAFVAAEFSVKYSVRGLTDLIKKHGFSFHKPAGIPSKADKNAQADFVEKYEKLKVNLDENDKIVFVDGVHPTHAVRFVHGWIRKGVRREIPTNGGQKRLNILGGFDLQNMQLYSRDFTTLNSENFNIFLQHLLTKIPSGNINIILDRGGYQHCKAVWEFVENNPRICLHYLPPYSPNLNTIERLWKLLHEHTTNNIYHPNFKSFTEKIHEFFNKTFAENKTQWASILTDNFRITNSPLNPT